MGACGDPCGPASALTGGVAAPMAFAERAVLAAPSLPTLGVGRGMRAPPLALPPLMPKQEVEPVGVIRQMNLGV